MQSKFFGLKKCCSLNIKLLFFAMDLLNEAIFVGIGHEHDSVRSFAHGGCVCPP